MSNTRLVRKDLHSPYVIAASLAYRPITSIRSRIAISFRTRHAAGETISIGKRGKEYLSISQHGTRWEKHEIWLCHGFTSLLCPGSPPDFTSFIPWYPIANDLIAEHYWNYLHLPAKRFIL